MSEEKMRIAIWGTGYKASLMMQFPKDNYSVVCFIDNDKDKIGSLFYDRLIVGPKGLNSIAEDIDAIIISIADSFIRSRILMQMHTCRQMIGKKVGFLISERYSLSDWGGVNWTRITGKIILPYLETNIIDTCNMKCSGCSHFAPLFSETDYSSDEFEVDMLRLSENVDIINLHILGGEPFLCKELDKYISVARCYFPETDIEIVTNGTLINRVDPYIFDVIRNNRITICISRYKPTIVMEGAITKRLVEERISYRFGPKIDSFLKFININGDSDIRFAHKECFHKNCLFLRKGRLYHCPTEALMYKYVDYFRVETIKEYQEKGLTISDLFDEKQIISKLLEPIEMCRYCSDNKKPAQIIEWNQKSVPEKEDWLIK